MAGTTRNLRLWDAGSPGLVESGGRPGDWPPEAAERLFVRETFRKPCADAQLPEPFTRAWYDVIERQRYARQGYWIPSLLEFRRHAGETLLALGEGLGTDWVQYARNAAKVIVCSPSQEQLALVRTNCELHGVQARYLHAPPQCVPVAAESVDVVCVQGLLHEIEQPDGVIDEFYRVLRPGGKAIVVAPAKYGVAYWYAACFPLVARLKTPDAEAIPTATTGRGLRRAFARFADHKVYKRHLRRAEMPHLWRWLPLPVTERLMGNYLIFKAFKPLSAAKPVAAAAA